MKLTNNTIAKNIKILKTFLKWATERGSNTNLTYIKFKATEKDVDIIYLTEQELLSIYNLNLAYFPLLEKVRDTFCFSCFTGLRFSDLSRVNKENVKGDEIYLVTEKTADRLYIPLNDYAKGILKKYNYSLPVLSNQKTNEHLKSIGLLAKIKEPVTLTKYRGAEEIKETKPKCEFIGTHTARRTFITLSLEKNMRPEIVMSIVGTKDYKSFKKYIKITDKVKLIEMKRAWDDEPKLKVVV